MTKVQVLTCCEFCKGKPYIPIGEATGAEGEPYIHYQPCDYCNGSGNQPKWVSPQEFAQLFLQEQCLHIHTFSQGGFHLWYLL
jgi:hypothetical protein